MMHNPHRHERGFTFASLAVVTVFMLVSGLILSTVIGKNIYTSRQTHRLLIREQAYWLAESAIERALANLQTSSTAQINQPYTIRVAPIFINPELITDSEIQSNTWPPSIEANYRYELQPAVRFQSLMPNAAELVLITGHSDVPYRQTHITETVTRLGYRTLDGVWKSLPITTHP